jgi:hypothetical protein
MPILPVGLDWYHTSIAVADVEVAAAHYAATFGFAFTEPSRSSQRVLTPNGRVRRTTITVISMGVDHRLELGQVIEGPYVPQHVGCFATDLTEQFDRLATLGWDPMFWGEDGDASGRLGSFSYHRDPVTGAWVELIDASIRPQMERWMSGHRLDHASVQPTPRN